MNTESRQNNDQDPEDNPAAGLRPSRAPAKSASKSQPATLPQWAECDFFCINGYAGTGASACGWRGCLQNLRHDASGSKLLCPRCGCATLLRIPLGGATQEGT